MAMDSVGAIINHSMTISNMIAVEQERERKHAINPRCKPANFGGVASYIEYATGVKCSAEDVKKVLTKQPISAIIKTQKGSERNEKSSEVKPTRQEIAETHSPKVMHIRAGQQCDRVLSEVRRRVEPVGTLALFIWRRADVPGAPHFTRVAICTISALKIWLFYLLYFIPKWGIIIVSRGKRLLKGTTQKP